MSEARIIDIIKIHESGFDKMFDIGRWRVRCGGGGRGAEREAPAPMHPQHPPHNSND